MAGSPDLPGREDVKSLPSGPVDLSPAVTTVAFETVVPVLRVPLPAGDDDEPSKGPYVLAFKDEDSWRRAWRRCEDKVAGQCEVCCFPQSGARMGCSISAGNICRLPWWKTMLPFFKVSAAEEAEREACEEREMMACLAASKESCVKYAQETCEPVFAELRIAERDQVIDPRFNGKKPPRLLNSQRNNFVKKPGDRRQAGLCAFEQIGEPQVKARRSTNFRGKHLMERGANQRVWEAPVWSDAEESADTAVAKEPAIDGWEGGLVRPKYDSKKFEQSPIPQEQPEVLVRRSPSSLWEDLLNKLKDFRFQ